MVFYKLIQPCNNLLILIIGNTIGNILGFKDNTIML